MDRRVGSVWKLSPPPVNDYLSLSKAARASDWWSLDVVTRFAPLFLRGLWLEKHAETTKAFLLPRLAKQGCRYHRSSISVAGPGIVLLYMCCEPRERFLVLSAVLLFTSFHFSFSSIAQTLKNVGPLDCKLRLDGRRSNPLAASFRSRSSCTWLWTFSLQTQRAFVFLHCCFCCFFSSFLYLFSLSLSFFSVVTFFVRRNSLGLHVHWVIFHSTTTRCVDIGFAFKALSHFAMGKRAGFSGAHSVQAQRRLASTARRPVWCP